MGHVGESRVIIGSDNGNVEYLNTLHKPSNPLEKERIISQGGKIYRVILDKVQSDHSLNENSKFYGPLRVFPGNLIVSRTLGCRYAKSQSKNKIITAIPEIAHYEIKNEDEFIFMACDGVYEHLTKEDVASIIKCTIISGQSIKQYALAVNNIIKAATIARTKESLTCILIILKHINPALDCTAQEIDNQIANVNALHMLKLKPLPSKKQIIGPNIRYNPPQKNRMAYAEKPTGYSLI